MPRWAHNKTPTSVKARYFELVRDGMKGTVAWTRGGIGRSARILDRPYGRTADCVVGAYSRLAARVPRCPYA